MKLEIGKFIRTKPSGLILEVTEEMINGIKSYIGEEKYQVYDNIIDLIEVGDIVKYNDEDCYGNHIFIEDVDYNLLERLKNDPMCHLLEILTHEQFENNCFRIGDE